MKLNNIWMVMNPTPNSELGDIFFEAYFDGGSSSNPMAVNFHDWHLGASLGPGKFRGRNLTLYTEEGEALKDAEMRMKGK